jgi:ABC-type branched-subunit amino acid transport system substrate-binding protein
MAPDAFAPVWALWDQAGPAARDLYIATGGIPNERLGPAGRRFVQEFGGTQPRGVVGALALATAASTEAMLAAIARSDGTRASVARELLRTRLADSVLGSLAFDRYGDTTNPAVMVLRVERREDVSDVEGFEGAAVERVIHPPVH